MRWPWKRQHEPTADFGLYLADHVMASLREDYEKHALRYGSLDYAIERERPVVESFSRHQEAWEKIASRMFVVLRATQLQRERDEAADGLAILARLREHAGEPVDLYGLQDEFGASNVERALRWVARQGISVRDVGFARPKVMLP